MVPPPSLATLLATLEQVFTEYWQAARQLPEEFSNLILTEEQHLQLEELKEENFARFQIHFALPSPCESDTELNDDVSDTKRATTSIQALLHRFYEQQAKWLQQLV